ncbi:MAG: HAMP domain-containing sensor histidine kinase [Pirellulales bacterium]
MQRLPEVVTTRGTLVLPLCGGTARRLAAALIAGRDFRGDRALLAEALARDAALSLWAVVRSHGLGATELRTVDALADWLSATAMDPWSRPAESDPSASPKQGDAAPINRSDQNQLWATLAVRSFAAATWGAQIARQQKLDDGAAYLLGLLHLAPQWLAAASGDAQIPPADVLPPWLHSQLDHVGTGPPGKIASSADCVGFAVKLAEADGPGEPLPAGFTLDQPAHAAAVARVRDDWLCEAPPSLLRDLVEKLRRLRDLEESFGQTLEAEKLESLKELAYGAGHEINNPLANISARAQTLLQGERDPERRRMLASINSQAFRAHEMIADMMLFARPPSPKPQPLDIVELLKKLHGELGEQAAAQRTELVLHAPRSPVEVVADKTQIAVALRSLCANALEALVTGGRVEIALAEPADGRVQITVSDNGPGIPPEVRPHVFDPFYSGREAGRGLGLGLSKCWRIVTMHRGRVDVDSPNGRGAAFTVTLPGGGIR